jgi:hypothetical protein
MEGVGGTKERVGRQAPVESAHARKQSRCEWLPVKGAFRAIGFKLIHQRAEGILLEPALAPGAVQRRGEFGLCVSGGSHRVLGAQLAHGLEPVIIQIKPDQITGIAVNHDRESALISARISSMDRSPGFGLKAPSA